MGGPWQENRIDGGDVGMERKDDVTLDVAAAEAKTVA